jgi:hypothetical protein
MPEQVEKVDLTKLDDSALDALLAPAQRKYLTARKASEKARADAKTAELAEQSVRADLDAVAMEMERRHK